MRDGFHVRLPAHVRAAAQALASEAGLSAPAWVRGLIVRAVEADPRDVRPSRRRSPRPAPPSDHVRQLVALQESVAEFGGALVQSAAYTHRTGADLHAELEALIPEIKRASRELVALIQAERSR